MALCTLDTMHCTGVVTTTRCVDINGQVAQVAKEIVSAHPKIKALGGFHGTLTAPLVQVSSRLLR